MRCDFYVDCSVWLGWGFTTRVFVTSLLGRVLVEGYWFPVYNREVEISGHLCAKYVKLGSRRWKWRCRACDDSLVELKNKSSPDKRAQSWMIWLTLFLSPDPISVMYIRNDSTSTIPHPLELPLLPPQYPSRHHQPPQSYPPPVPQKSHPAHPSHST